MTEQGKRPFFILSVYDLLMVVGLISVLAAVAVPAFISYMREPHSGEGVHTDTPPRPPLVPTVIPVLPSEMEAEFIIGESADAVGTDEESEDENEAPSEPSE